MRARCLIIRQHANRCKVLRPTRVCRYSYQVEPLTCMHACAHWPIVCAASIISIRPLSTSLFFARGALTYPSLRIDEGHAAMSDFKCEIVANLIVYFAKTAFVYDACSTVRSRVKIGLCAQCDALWLSCTVCVLASKSNSTSYHVVGHCHTSCKH